MSRYENDIARIYENFDNVIALKRVGKKLSWTRLSDVARNNRRVLHIISSMAVAKTRRLRHILRILEGDQ